MSIDVPTVLGWVGMVLLLFAYWRRRSLPTRAYGLLNFLGAGLIAVICVAQRAWPPFALEVAWALVAVRDILQGSRGETGTSHVRNNLTADPRKD